MDSCCQNERIAGNGNKLREIGVKAYFLFSIFVKEVGECMGAEIDRLEVQVQASAAKANSALDNLTKKLETLSSSLSKINGSGLAGLANGVQKLGTAMQSMNNVRTADFSRLARNIEKLGNINTASLNSAASSMSHLTRAFNQLGTVSVNAQQVGELARNISRLGNKGVQNAVTNIPSLATALRNLMQTLSTAPRVSNNVIQMTNALANLASQGGRVGSASNSLIRGLNSTNTAMLRTRKNTLSLAAAFGKFYATYFLVIRGIKKLWSSIEGSMDYVETFNYFSVALDKIGKEFGGQFEKYGYDSAEAYANSFSSRLEELTTKMTGYSIGDNGELLSSNKIGLGLDPNQLMQFQAQVSSVTNSVGLIGETSTNVSKALSMLSSDMSSLFNVDLSTVMTNLQSGLIGQSRALYKYGIDITNTTLQQYAYQYGVEKSVSAMSQAEKMQLRMLAILDQSKVAWGDQANTINSVANQYRVFKQQIANVGRTIGNLFLPIVQKVLPYVNGLIIAVNRLLTSIGFKIHGGNWLKDIMDGISGGSAASDALEGITDDTDEMADSLDNASKSANKLKGMLQKFDELNNISTQNSESDSSSGSGKGGSDIDLSDAIAASLADYESVWNKALADSQNKAEEIANNIINAFKKGDYEGIGTYISTGISSALKKIDWTKAYSNAKSFGTGLAQFFNGLITPDLFGTVGKTVAGSLNTAIYTALSFGKTFDFANLGESIGAGVTEFFRTFDFKSLAETINVWVDGIKTALWKALTTTDRGQVFGGIMDFVGTLEWDTIGIAIGAFAWFHGGKTLTVKLFKEVITKVIGLDKVITLGCKIALVVGVAKIGFDVGKEIGKLLFPEDAEYYEEFSWKDVFSSFTDGSWKGALEEIGEEIRKNLEVKMAEVSTNVTISLSTILVKFAEVKKYISKGRLEVQTKVENIKEKVKKGWEEVQKYWKKKDVLEKVQTTYENFKENVQKGWTEVQGYWKSKEALKEVKTTYENFKNKVKEKWENAIEYWETKKKALAEVRTTYENFKSKVEGKWNEVTTYWTKKTGLSEITAGVADLKSKLSGVWNELKTWWDRSKPSLSEITANIKLPHLKVEWDVEGVAAKALQKLGLKGFPNFSVSYYAQGGFPEDGWFRANHGEIMGKFDNGQSVVASNRQITDGIAIAVNKGNQENNMLMRQEISLLQRQNELLMGILEKETGISSNDIFNSVRKSAREYSNRTGNPAFDY